VIYTSSGGKSDAWTRQEWGQSTILLHSNSKPDIANNTNIIRVFYLKTRKTFIVYMIAVSTNHAKSRSVISALVSVHDIMSHKKRLFLISCFSHKQQNCVWFGSVYSNVPDGPCKVVVTPKAWHAVPPQPGIGKLEKFNTKS
jgi:hypothetical protein